MGNAQNLLKLDLLWSEGGEGADLSPVRRSAKNSQESLRDLGFGVVESEREHFECLEILE